VSIVCHEKLFVRIYGLFELGTGYADGTVMNGTYVIENKETAMYAKFPFYSVAQMYALSLDIPVAIMLGGDNLYWVVDQTKEHKYVEEGCSLLSYAA
jgi:hypothetical protein